ncbi:hypothetical protein BFJ63_vAg16674 [Fusarium oxysporum f. sp. narcissi]|uniref:FAD-binding domain-containing protein n=1 Tax=Fusarium oxysporum f. sp. narcissi TaxID=451672 RepID=A0A4Q2V6X2_FUSOX|nr:hypothetical protein BFJ63_vAg16674 [Fusarium oxysporum f. sp. narcissi]
MTVTTSSTNIAFDNGAGLSLDIGIVGAGIAGLSAAAALARLGHRVDIYERSHFSNEIGAAVNIGPNAGPVMKALGFDITGAKLLEAQEGKQFDAVTMETMYHGNYEDFTSRFGAPWYFSHRVDLHNELRRLAVEPSEKFPGSNLHLGKTVKSVDCEANLVIFQDGTKEHKDVIIAADGIHSVIAPCILGSDIPAASINECAYRFLIPTAKLRENPATAGLFQEDKTTFHVASKADRRLVWYPCRDGQIQNFAGIHPAKAGRQTEEDWHAQGNKNDLLDTFSGFHPSLVEICKSAEELKLWKLQYRAPIDRWTKQGVILIGDAAHPMLPHQGQGANQAIEDAGALGILLSNISDRKDIARRLELVQSLRRKRSSAMQVFSNAGQDQSHRIIKEVQPFMEGPVPKNQGEFHQWNFGYNILQEAQLLLEKVLA